MAIARPPPGSSTAGSAPPLPLPLDFPTRFCYTGINQKREGLPMLPVVSVQTMRECDAWTIEHETPGPELMLRAARGIRDAVDWDRGSPAAVSYTHLDVYKRQV